MLALVEPRDKKAQIKVKYANPGGQKGKNDPTTVLPHVMWSMARESMPIKWRRETTNGIMKPIAAKTMITITSIRDEFAIMNFLDLPNVELRGAPKVRPSDRRERT
jgi:hypothetical protein